VGLRRSAIADNLRRFVAAGGGVALGTDYQGAPNVHFDQGMPITEIVLMAQAGMTPMQIIVAATRDAAHACGPERELGTLEPGKLADVLVVEGDPLTDLRALTQTRMVVRDGVIIMQRGQ
jgi:imidazolonepropionase-like amidohydrolase